MLRILKSNNGSVTLEAAFLMPLIILVFVAFAGIINAVAAQACINDSLCKTADFMSKYAFCYNEKGVERLERTAIKKIDELLSEHIESEKIREKIYEYIDFDKLVDYADDYVYRQIAHGIFHVYMEENRIYKSGFINIDDYSLEGSTFFNGNDDIVLKISADCGLLNLKSAVRVGCWSEGKMSSVIVSNQNVWALDNFSRGRTIRDVFGGTLPYNFPVIAVYAYGSAIAIKSLDHTADTYKDADRFEKEIRSMIDNLARYDGEEDMPISSKTLTLVIPENQMTPAQSSVMGRMMSYASANGIFLDLQLYQES